MFENTMNNLKIGVDVGGTKIEAVLVDAMGTVLGSARIPARHGNDAVIEDIVAVAHQAAGERFDEVRAIGVGTPGTVDSASGHVGNIVNLDVVSLDMGPLISHISINKPSLLINVWSSLLIPNSRNISSVMYGPVVCTK